MSQDILIVGKKDSILGFKSVGVKTLFWVDADTTKNNLETLIKNGARIIFLTEDIFELCQEVMDDYKDSIYPMFIPIPSLEVNKGLGYNKVKQLEIEALGQASSND